MSGDKVILVEGAEEILTVPGNKILLVDDEEEIIKALRRRLRHRFELDSALSGAEGLKAILERGPFAVVVSDYRMPEMDGVEFLGRVREVAPDTVLMMLTGQLDLDVAVRAINEGRVFRFMTKPCPPEVLARAMEEGIKYHQLILAERELQGLRKWRKSMERMILAFAKMVEARDPYTAGHQRRVANLSCLLAERLGLSAGRVEAIRMAATVHDIGKIYVPAEFLNKPGRLSDLEFGVIKLHPQVGYDILKSIDFEYPISNMVRQHHERIDGSGYPLGLRGEDILLESKIIAVADVLEAISSHRPYRPSLGLDVGLKEVEKNQGVIYDPDAAQASLELLRGKETLDFLDSET